MITYFDTSALLKLLVDDEMGTANVEQLWQASTIVVCAEIGYVEARAALAAATRARRLTAAAWRAARVSLDSAWAQLEVVPVTTALVRDAAEVAESNGLRGYDAVHLAAALIIPADTFVSGDNQLCSAAASHNLHIANPNSPPPPAD